MLKSFLILDLPMDATDDQIRKKYLSLIKENRPDSTPDKFKKINAAYEAVKDKRSRIKTKMFSAFMDMECEETLQTLAESINLTKKETNLKSLTTALTNK